MFAAWTTASLLIDMTRASSAIPESREWPFVYALQLPMAAFVA